MGGTLSPVEGVLIELLLGHDEVGGLVNAAPPPEDIPMRRDVRSGIGPGSCIYPAI